MQMQSVHAHSSPELTNADRSQLVRVGQLLVTRPELGLQVLDTLSTRALRDAIEQAFAGGAQVDDAIEALRLSAEPLAREAGGVLGWVRDSKRGRRGPVR